jgi:hypothetical protein
MIIPQTKTKENIFNEQNLKTVFTETAVSNNITMTYLEDFKKSIKFSTLLEKHLNEFDSVKGANSTYKPIRIVDFMIDAVIFGYSRFDHMEQLRKDEAYTLIKQHSAPSEKVCRDLLKALPDNACDNLRALNKSLLETQANTQAPREVMIDFDDTVVTVFGNQEKANVGYNPKYHGRPSYKEKVGIISGTKELVDLTLEEGSHHSNHCFLDFFKKCEETLPKQWILKRIRGDRGFFDQDNFNYFEGQQYEYIVKAKMQNGVKKIVDYVVSHPAEYKWQEIDKTFSATDIFVPLPAWDKARRFVIVRKTLPNTVDSKQLIIDMDEFKYEYQAIVTNVDYLTPAEIFEDYNQRCTIETNIDELKSGFAFSENSQINYQCNELFLLIKMIAYNLHNWFKNCILPEELRHHRITTLRRKLYHIPGIIAGNGWYKHIKLQKNDKLEKVFIYIQNALFIFRNQVMLN